MALVQTDRTKSEDLEPIVLKPKTVNTNDDAATLGPDELQVATDIVLDNGYIEKATGTTKVNSDNTTAVSYAFHRAYGLASERVALRLSNGILKSGLSAFSTTVLSNLASLVTPFVNAPNGMSYGINTTDGVIRYNPATITGLKTGIIGPYLRKQIAFFESDETWSTTLGASQSSDYYRPDEWTGYATKSLKLVVSAAGGSCGSSAALVLDLSQFANTKISDADDYIAFHTFHLVRDDLNYMTVEFSTGNAAFTTKKMVTLYRADFEENDYEWTFWKVKKSAFLDTGSPDWATVKAGRIYAYAATGKTTTLYVDFMHMRITQLRVKELNKVIAACNQSETWTNVSGGSLSFDNQNYTEGFCSMKQTTSGRNYRTVSLDLTKWADNRTVQTSDEIALQARLTARANFTKLKLMVCKTSAAYYAHDILPADVPANDQFFDIATSLSNFSAVGGMSAWGTITRIDLSATFAGACTLNVDDIRLQPHTTQKQLALCEASETWVFDNAEISTKKQAVVQGTGCLQLKGHGSVMKTSTGTVSLSAARNLTTWDDGSASNTDDLICFNLYHSAIKKIDYLLVYIGDADLSDYYYYQVNKTEFETQGTKSNVGGEVRIAKSKFTTVGSPNWNAIAAIRFTAQAKNGGDIYIDDVTMKRQEGITGRYYYKYLFKFKDIRSAFSEDSEYVDAKGGYISLSLIKSSDDTDRITSKEIYRKGGGYPDTWYRVGDIPNLTEEFIDKLDDSDLDYPLVPDVPEGNINNIPCSNLVYDSKSDRMLYWGDTSYRDRVYVSNAVYYHVVDETSYRVFPGEVMGVIPWHGQTVVVCRDKVVRVDGDFLTGDMIDVPVPMGGCSHYCADRISEGLLVYAGMDNVYLLDGYRSRTIGDEIADYFSGRESYLSSVYTKFNSKDESIYIAVKANSGTPTYNSKVLRYYIPEKSWTILSWNANLFALFNGQGDDNSLWYADSLATTGDVVKTGSSTYQYKAAAISSEAKTGWFNDPLAELSIRMIELKAKGTGVGTLTVTGYKNLSESAAAFTGTITLTTSWVTYTISNPLLERTMTGDHLELKFTHATDVYGFSLKDIVIYMQKTPKRRTLTEVTIS